MKVHELFESGGLELWTRSGHFVARIRLGSYYDYSVDRDSLALAKKDAQAKLNKAVKDHKDGLRFTTVEEAEKEAKALGINYPLLIQVYDPKTKKYKKSIELKTKVDFSSFKKQSFDDLKIEKVGDKFKVSIEFARGEPLEALKSLMYLLAKNKKCKLFSLSNEELDKKGYFYNYKGRGFFVKGITEEELKDAIKQSSDKSQKEKQKREEHKALVNSKEYKQAKNKENYEYQKAAKNELYAKYGKDIVDRVKIKSMSSEGDDGYQWAMFVDGKRIQSGMTQYQARGEQRIYWRYLLKLSKMTPEELQKEKDANDGVRAYFLMQALEKQLPIYLKQISSNSKMALSAKEKAEKEYKDLIKRLNSKAI